MPKRSALLTLLQVETEPTQKYYKEVVDETTGNPQQISGLVEENVRDDVLILLTTHHHRLAQFFRRLRSIARQTSKSATTGKIAAESVELLIDILPYLHQLLEPTKVLDFLLPALDVCFAASQRLALRELASVLTYSGTLLEHLVSDHLGVEIIRQWASMQSTIALDAGTLSLWTERLVSMVHKCGIDHGVALETQQWHTLKALKGSLQNMEQGTSRSSGKHHTPTTRHELSALGSMTKLNREDKKGRLAKHHDTQSTIPSLQDDDKRSLKTFDLHVPGSKSSLQETIKRLEGEKTTAILLSIASRLPCYLCISSLESSAHTSKGETYSESFQALSVPHVEILDKGIGIWKVLLSPQALRSVLHMGSHGFKGSITEKLNQIASGCWDLKNESLAGSKSQRKSLKVPVVKTPCGQNQFVLWQIAIGIDEETGVPEQEIKVWELCGNSEIPRVINRVSFLHQSYSDETVSRCRPQSSIDAMQIPARFEDSSSKPIRSVRPSADLDIRTVDQDIIEMTNKFFALTEPVIRSILSNDLSAEFSFDLSREEASIIRHFRTASLILGRSGTGKTTCLVFKLVGKYLASKAVADERPVRQVLLTRSVFLADKLNSYTRRLIKTLSTEVDPSQPSEHIYSVTAKESFEKYTI